MSYVKAEKERNIYKIENSKKHAKIKLSIANTAVYNRKKNVISRFVNYLDIFQITGTIFFILVQLDDY